MEEKEITLDYNGYEIKINNVETITPEKKLMLQIKESKINK